MELNQIQLMNFRGVNHFSVEPTKLMAFLDRNGAGKTSILQAIRAAITGEFPDNAIKNNATSTTVAVGFKATGDVISRKQEISANGLKTTNRLNNKTTSGKSIEEYLQTLTGISHKTLKMMTSSEVIGQMNADEFGEILLQYLHETLNFDKVLRYCGVISPDTADFLQNMLPAMPQVFGTDRINELYATCYEQRTEVNRSIKSLEPQSVFTGAIPTRTLADIDADLDRIRGQEASQQLIQDAMKQYNQVLETINKQRKAIADLQNKINTLNATRPNPQEKANLEAQLQRIKKDLEDTKQLINILDVNIKTDQSVLDNLDKPVCPISEKLCCTTDKSFLSGELKETLKTNKKFLQDAQQKVANLTATKDALDQQLKEYDKNAENYQKKIEYLQQINTLTQALPAEPTKPTVIPQDYTKEKEILNNERNTYVDYETKQKMKKQLDILYTQLAILEEVLKVFGKNGEFKKNVIGYYLQDLEDTMNARAASLRPDFRVKLTYNKGVYVTAETKLGNGYIPWKSTSSGEQAFILFLILDMLNQLTGLNIILLDDLEKLDANAFKILVDTLNHPSVTSTYDHIFIAAAYHEDELQTLQNTSFHVIQL